MTREELVAALREWGIVTVLDEPSTPAGEHRLRLDAELRAQKAEQDLEEALAMGDAALTAAIADRDLARAKLAELEARCGCRWPLPPSDDPRKLTPCEGHKEWRDAAVADEREACAEIVRQFHLPRVVEAIRSRSTR